MIATEEQFQRIKRMLAEEGIYNRRAIESPREFGDAVDMIYIDGNISFDKMAEIVDFLRSI